MVSGTSHFGTPSHAVAVYKAIWGVIYKAICVIYKAMIYKAIIYEAIIFKATIYKTIIYKAIIYKAIWGVIGKSVSVLLLRMNLKMLLNALTREFKYAF